MRCSAICEWPPAPRLRPRAYLPFEKSFTGLVETISWSELRSVLILLAMTFVGLPIMPDHPIGPFGGVNPREVWIIAIVLACVATGAVAGAIFVGIADVDAITVSMGRLTP
jgi:uncharacterized membrane protein (DUF4010 family)